MVAGIEIYPNGSHLKWASILDPQKVTQIINHKNHKSFPESTKRAQYNESSKYTHICISYIYMYICIFFFFNVCIDTGSQPPLKKWWFGNQPITNGGWTSRVHINAYIHTYPYTCNFYKVAFKKKPVVLIPSSRRIRTCTP